MLATLILMFVTLGLGGWVPMPERDASPLRWLGLRQLIGFCLLMLGLIVLDVVLAVPLSVAVWIMVALAVGGGGRWVFAARGLWGRVGVFQVFHPVLILPVLAVVVMAFVGGLEYLPYASDELTHWLARPRQAFVLDTVLPRELPVHLGGYTPGWFEVLAFPNLLLGRFDEAYSAVVPFVMHVGLIGLVYDVLRGSFDRLGKLGVEAAALCAWLVVLILLSVEATWRLFPTVVLIERPQIYVICALTVLAMAALLPGLSRGRILMAMGLIFAAGYATKISVGAFGPSLALLTLAVAWGWEKKGARKWGLAGLAVFGPVLLLYLIWLPHVGETGCLSNPLQVLSHLGSLDRASDLAGRFFAAVWDYLSHYKVGLTLLTLAGLGSALTSRRLWPVVPALAGFWVLYFAALYVYHLDCLGEYYFRELNSIQRFTRVPLRLLHLVGLVVPILVGLERARGRLSALNHKRALGAMGLAVLVLLGWQGYKLERAFKETGQRFEEIPGTVKVTTLVKEEAARLVVRLRERNVLGASVLFVAQGDSGVALQAALYYRLNLDRSDVPVLYNLRHQWSWGSDRANYWMAATADREMTEILRGQSVIWPYQLNDWMRARLKPLISNPVCAAQPEAYFLFKDGEGFTCVPKN